jgi:hypothetical protein
MENSRFQTIVIIILVGLILAGVAFYLRHQATREEPPPLGYYTGPMLPKSQRMGPMLGMPSANPPTAPSPNPPQGGR